MAVKDEVERIQDFGDNGRGEGQRSLAPRQGGSAPSNLPGVSASKSQEKKPIKELEYGDQVGGSDRIES